MLAIGRVGEAAFLRNRNKISELMNLHGYRHSAGPALLSKRPERRVQRRKPSIPTPSADEAPIVNSTIYGFVRSLIGSNTFRPLGVNLQPREDLQFAHPIIDQGHHS